MESGLQSLLVIVKMIEVILDACCMRTHETMFLHPKHKYIVKATKQRHARGSCGESGQRDPDLHFHAYPFQLIHVVIQFPSNAVHTSHSPLSHARIKLTCLGAQLSHVGTSVICQVLRDLHGWSACRRDLVFPGRRRDPLLAMETGQIMFPLQLHAF
jgi:hypothetical protein